MKPTLKKIFTLSLLLSFSAILVGNCCSDSCCALPIKSNDCITRCCGYPFLGYRSQSANIARRIVGTQAEIHKYGMDDKYWSSYIALEYTRSFKPERILTDLLGLDACNCNLIIQGSKVADRNSRAWLADYFGLPMDFESTICLEPVIQNFIIDLHYYAGLDNWKEGMFFRIYAPLVYTRWDLNMCEKVKTKGEMCFPKGYMSSCEIPRADLPQSFCEVMKGCTTFGDMTCPIKYGLMSPCKETDTRLADLRAELGCNFALKEDYHVGLAFHAAAPTGTRPKAYYLFEPMVGNGRHWELGISLTSSYIMWRGEKEDKFLGVYFDAVLTHMFKACQTRSFDYLCKPNSRYALLEVMGPNDADIGRCDGGCCQGNNCCAADCNCLANYTYASKLVPAINTTTYCVDSKIDIQADLALKFAYYSNCWSFDLGYNFWVRTGEEFYLREACCSPCGKNHLAFKGDAYLYGKYELNNIDYIVPLSATQSQADIHKGTNYPLLPGEKDATDACDTSVRASYNPRIDNPKKAYSYVFPLTDLYGCAIVDDTPNVNTSIQPVVLNACDIDMYKGPKAYTHKIFAHINYKWNREEKDTNPYLGIGGEAEFGGDCKCKDNCKNPHLGVSQWGIWLKAGCSYE
ncbi:hypothetical protein ACFLYU_03300 [Candidatus Dependentiae bacterium]